MRSKCFAISCLFWALLVSGCTGVPTAPREFTVVEPDTSEGELGPILRAEATKARELGRRPFVECSATWCPPCNALKKSLDDPLMQQAFKGTYIIVLDVDKWGNQFRSAGISADAIPVILEIGPDGRPTGRRIDAGAWEANIPENMAPPLRQFFNGE